MTKKCLRSFIVYVLLSAICLGSMHLMLLFQVNKYVGVSVGGGMLALSLVLFIIFYKKKIRNVSYCILFVNAIGCGFAISSLYVYLGSAPRVFYTACIWGTYVVLFLAYCLLAHTSLFKRFPRICLAVYGLIILVAGIVGIILSSTIVFSLALMMFILFIAFLATIIVPSANISEHNNILALVSFVGLFIIIIVVIIVISEGDGLDGLDFTPSDKVKGRSKNPYDFIVDA